MDFGNAGTAENKEATDALKAGGETGSSPVEMKTKMNQLKLLRKKRTNNSINLIPRDVLLP